VKKFEKYNSPSRERRLCRQTESLHRNFTIEAKGEKGDGSGIGREKICSQKEKGGIHRQNQSFAIDDAQPGREGTKKLAEFPENALQRLAATTRRRGSHAGAMGEGRTKERKKREYYSSYQTRKRGA